MEKMDAPVLLVIWFSRCDTELYSIEVGLGEDSFELCQQLDRVPYDSTCAVRPLWHHYGFLLSKFRILGS